MNQENQFTELSKKFTIPFWISILIIAIAALLAIALILKATYWTVEPLAIEIPKKSLTDNITNWQTYRNEEYGFEVKYPENWFIADSKNEYLNTPRLNSFRLVFTPDKKILKEALYNGKLIPLTHGWYDLDIHIEERTLAEQGIDILISNDDHCKIVDFIGIRSRKCLRTGISEIGDRLGPSMFFDYNNRGWGISWPTLSEDTLNYDPIYDKILSTFKFIE